MVSKLIGPVGRVGRGGAEGGGANGGDRGVGDKYRFRLEGDMV